MGWCSNERQILLSSENQRSSDEDDLYEELNKQRSFDEDDLFVELQLQKILVQEAEDSNKQRSFDDDDLLVELQLQKILVKEAEVRKFHPDEIALRKIDGGWREKLLRLLAKEKANEKKGLGKNKNKNVRRSNAECKEDEHKQNGSSQLQKILVKEAEVR
ncbi:uncharacterized protein LOC128239962 [Mya arenaria]|uniref:uncharacterized protein LOC128239962 n=1 Tax=Mya arenaria TaxID=6604 RepID=UPI0022E29323|nr:uncharacterized protein LOC128239962 [Mya arenaria]